MLDRADADAVKAVAQAAGIDAVGIAAAEPFDATRRELERRKAAGLHAGMGFTYRRPAVSADPRNALPGAQALVVGARAYAGGEPAGPSASGPHGRVAAYAREDTYAALRASLRAVAQHLKAGGWRARVLADDNALVDREAARRAGLGWYGKSANILLPGQGSWFVLGSVVTTAPLPPDEGEVADGCGACRRCLDGCPTGAIVAPGVVDARRCLSWLLQQPGTFPVEHRVALGDRIYGCDDCQLVCPPNRARRPTGDDAPGSWVPLLDLLAGSDEEILATHGRWYIAGRDPRWVRRNALVAIGNAADPRDHAARAALAAHCDGDDELLAEHARWARGRLDERAAAPC